MRCEKVMFLPPILICNTPLTRSASACNCAVPVVPAGATADERIIDCVSMPIAGGQFAAIQRLVPQDREKVGYGVIAYASTLPCPSISQVFLKVGHEHLGADLIDTGRYGFARCPCGRAEQGYRHRQDGAVARAKSVQLNRTRDLTEHARDRHYCGDGGPLSKLSAASDNPCKRCVAHRSCTS